MSFDPLSADFPFYTPYQFAGNTPIFAIDLDGLEPFSGFKNGQNPTPAQVQTATNVIYGVYYPIGRTLTFGSMTGNVIYNGANFLWTGSTSGARTYYDYYNFQPIRYGSLQSDVVQQEMAWVAISEGAGTVAGIGLAGAFRAGKSLLLNVDLPSSSLVRRSGGAYEDYGGIAADGFRTGVEGIKANSRSIKNVSITMDGAKQVQEHLSNPYFYQGKGNKTMIDRLKKIANGKMEATDTDLYFYTHELREKELMNGVYTDDTYYKYHAQTAKEYGVKPKDETPTFYTKEAEDALWED